MSLTPAQQDTVNQYLKSIGINTMEFFEEMYDHICSSYESRNTIEQNISDHIRDVVQPGFGGVNGILKIKHQQEKLREKIIVKRFGKVFFSYLIGWPNLVITLLIGLLIFQLEGYFGGKLMVGAAVTLGLLAPVSFLCFKVFQFRYKCKKQRKAYNTCQVLAVFGPMMFFIFQIPNFAMQVINIFYTRQKVDSVLSNPWIYLPISVLLFLAMLAFQKVYREEFKVSIPKTFV